MLPQAKQTVSSCWLCVNLWTTAGRQFPGKLSSCLCLILLSWLQDETSLKAIHYVGAALVFLGGTLYCCIATAVGRHISIVHNQKLWKTYIRAMICVALVVFCIVGKL